MKLFHKFLVVTKENWDYSKVNITNRIRGLFYNHTSDTLYLFSKETPKTNYELTNPRNNKEK